MQNLMNNSASSSIQSPYGEPVGKSKFTGNSWIGSSEHDSSSSWVVMSPVMSELLYYITMTPALIAELANLS